MNRGYRVTSVTSDLQLLWKRLSLVVARVAAGLTILLVPGSCALPTDSSTELGVQLESDEVELLVGETRDLRFQVQGADLPPSAVLFESQDPGTVQTTGTGTLLGLAAGETSIVASLRGFDGARSDTVRVTVRTQLAFESVSPDTVRFGQELTIVGRTLDPARLSTLSIGGFPVSVSRFVRSAAADPSQRDTLVVLVPAGAGMRSSLVGLHVTGESDLWPLTVLQEDLYEPNDVSPAHIFDPLSFDNPQLAFEVGSRFDWYRLHGLPREFTIEVLPRLPIEGLLGDVGISAPRAVRDETPEWANTHVLQSACNGLTASQPRLFDLGVEARDTPVRFPVTGFTGDSLDLTLELESIPLEVQRYEVRLLAGYRSDFLPDANEPNNHCQQATAISGSYEGAVSLDTKVDQDWFRFTVAGDSAAFSAVATCEACGRNGIQLFLFRDATEVIPDGPDALQEVANAIRADGEASVSLSARLPAGDYFLSLSNLTFTPAERIRFQASLVPLR